MEENVENEYVNPIVERLKNKINSICEIIYEDDEVVEAAVAGHDLKFYKEDHEYYVDGSYVPSVTQLMKEVTPNIYAHVDPMVLKRAADRGTALHKEIENYEVNGVYGHSIEFDGYLKIKSEYDLEIIANEVFIIIFGTDKLPICAGRLDSVYLCDEENSKVGLIDFKRTSQYHEDNVTLQLNLYKKGFYQCYHIVVEELACVRLRDYVREFHYVDIDNNLANNKIKQYLLK